MSKLFSLRMVPKLHTDACNRLRCWDPYSIKRLITMVLYKIAYHELGRIIILITVCENETDGNANCVVRLKSNQI